MTQDVSVALPASSIYVSGSVNDVDVTWTLTGSNIWTAKAERSPDSIYRVKITAISSSGATTSSEFTLIYGIVPPEVLGGLVFDRVPIDAARILSMQNLTYSRLSAGELEEWDGLKSKGAWNYTDANRVEAWVAYLWYLVDLITDDMDGLDVQPHNWSEYSYYYFEDITELRDKITAFKDRWYKPSKWIDLTNTDAMTTQDANALEYDLFLLYNHAMGILNTYKYSGEIFSGETST